VIDSCSDENGLKRFRGGSTHRIINPEATLHRVMPLLFAVRPDVLDDVVEWAATFAPAADIVTVEQPLFWEHADELNAVLDRFLARLT